MNNNLNNTKKLADIKCFLLDMDGTVYLSGHAIDGAAESILRMRKRAKVLFLTNNTSVSRNDYVVKLNKMGIAAKVQDIYTAGNATIDYLHANDMCNNVYLFGTDALKQEFTQGGITLCSQNPSLVVIGFHTAFTYKDISLACDFIRRGVPFIATHPDFNCPVKDGYIPDVGSFLALIKASTNCSPILICGKPNAPIAKGAMQLSGASGKQVAMVGDRLMTDMQFAITNGLTSVLVLSGEATEQSLKESGLIVDCVLSSIAQIQ